MQRPCPRFLERHEDRQLGVLRRFDLLQVSAVARLVPCSSAFSGLRTYTTEWDATLLTVVSIHSSLRNGPRARGQGLPQGGLKKQDSNEANVRTRSEPDSSMGRLEPLKFLSGPIRACAVALGVRLSWPMARFPSSSARQADWTAAHQTIPHAL